MTSELSNIEEIEEEVQGLLCEIIAFHKGKKRKIARRIKKTAHTNQDALALKQFGLPLPADYRALYRNHNGIKISNNLPEDQTGIFFEFQWLEQHVLTNINKVIRAEKLTPNVHRRLLVFPSFLLRALYLDFDLQDNDTVPLVVRSGSLATNGYIAFDSVLAMLRSVHAAHQAGVIHYPGRAEPLNDADGGEAAAMGYQPKELWDVIKTFNSRATYWSHLIEGDIDWKEIDVSLPTDGVVRLSADVYEAVVGDRKQYLKDYPGDDTASDD
ncbi:MAG: SMI1/KNR4 family protein [Maricaulaceae bacterium]